MKTPVILLMFKRPETTERVLETIRAARPPKLLVVADGPRPDRPGEAEKCAETRALIERVDWDCEVLTHYSETNLGCKFRVSSGLDWAFGLVEEAIILEDDCVPNPTFFPYCEELLERHREDTRIAVIAGENNQLGWKRNEYSYYYSIHNHCWGWATWRRAWQYFDLDMKLWPQVRDEGWLNDILHDPFAVRYWNHAFQAAYEDRVNTWAFRWTFACWINHGLTILPSVNLISNIGFDENATHTTRATDMENVPSEPLQFPLIHPPFIIPDAQADGFTHLRMFPPALTLPERVVRKAKKIAGYGLYRRLR